MCQLTRCPVYRIIQCMLNKWLNLCCRIRPFMASDDTPERLHLYLDAMYDRPGHHTLSHIDDCLSVLDKLRVAGEPDNAEAIEFALWLHDAVYYPGSAENEVRSATVAESMLQELNGGAGCPVKPQDVRRLILATVPLEDSDAEDERIVSDIDLSILAAEPDRYDEYARSIQDEFLHQFTEAEHYRIRRRIFLGGFIRRPRIFQTDIMRAMFEDAARANIEREIGALAPEGSRMI